MKLSLVFIFWISFNFAEAKPPTQIVYGRHQNSKFEGKSCKTILENHLEATRYSKMPESPQMASYFNTYFESGENLCSKFKKSRTESVLEGIGQLRDKITPGKAVRETRDPFSQCLEASKLFTQEFKTGFEQLATIAQLRMTIYDSRLFETQPNLFTPGCLKTPGMKAIQPLASRLRSDKSMQDELLLSTIQYMTNEENSRCQVRSNAPQNEIKPGYTNMKDWEDRSLCQTFVNNWKEWKRLNTIKNQPATSDVENESSTCKLTCEFFDPHRTKILAAMSGNRCVLDKYMECYEAGKIPAPADLPDRPDEDAPAKKFRR